MVIELKPLVSSPISVAVKLNVSAPPERPIAVATAFGCKINAPLTEVIVPFANVSTSAVMVMLPEPEAISSPAVSVITAAPPPKSVSVTLPVVSAVMSLFRVRSPAVRVISILPPPAVCTPVPPMIRALFSSRKISLAVVTA